MQLYLWLVCSCEHGHLNVLSSDWFGLARGRRPGGLLVVAAHANKEEEQGDGQRDRHTGNQNVHDLHVAAARLVFIVCRDGRRERNNIRYTGYCMTEQYNVIKRDTRAETISRLIYQLIDRKCGCILLHFYNILNDKVRIKNSSFTTYNKSVN